MTPEAQRIAIAESCGWKLHPKDRFIVIPPNSPNSVQPLFTIPDYLNDLNAMHEAEKVLTTNEQLADYVIWLGRVVDLAGKRTKNHSFDIVNATAAQRREAFLRTLGKWTE